MNHMMLIARSADRLCARFTALFPSTLQAQDSIPQINSYAQTVDNFAHKLLTRLRHAHVIHMFDTAGTLWARAHQGLRASRLRIARSVAIVIGIYLCLPMSHASSGSIEAIQSVFQLADKQLTEKQEYCHNLIAFKESSNNRYAVNGSHHGYYQGRSVSLKGAPDDYQFYWYWHYVQHRYGTTQYDEPDYCKALHHLRVKGWQ
jgi:hypothetical protein